MTPVSLLPSFAVSPVSRRIHLVRQGRFALFEMLFAMLLALCGGLDSPVKAQQSKPEEYQVKAVYLYNFGKFVEWPAAASREDSFTICVLGRDPFGGTLDAAVAGETIGEKKMAARRIADVQDSTNCKILFISASEAGRLKQILAALGKSSVLTVSDMPDFTAAGGMIQFVLNDNKVRFEVNLGAAQKNGLTLSSQLLKVALAIRKEQPGEK